MTSGYVCVPHTRFLTPHTSSQARSCVERKNPTICNEVRVPNKNIFWELSQNRTTSSCESAENRLPRHDIYTKFTGSQETAEAKNKRKPSQRWSKQKSIEDVSKVRWMISSFARRNHALKFLRWDGARYTVVDPNWNFWDVHQHPLERRDQTFHSKTKPYPDVYLVRKPKSQGSLGRRWTGKWRWAFRKSYSTPRRFMDGPFWSTSLLQYK